MQEQPAIVMGLGVNALGVIRSLACLGVRCQGVYTDPGAEPARHSNRLAATARISAVAGDHGILATMEELRHACHGCRPVLFPTSDFYAEFVSRNREWLRTDYEFRCPPEPIHAAFVDKRQTAALCREHDVPIPRTWVPDTLEDITAACGTLKFPVIVKPATTFDGAFPGKNFVAADSSSLMSFMQEHAALIDRVVVQEVVSSGDGHIVISAVYSNAAGHLEALYTGRKIRQWRPDYGVTCFGVSETIPEIQDITRRFMEGIGYSGLAALEFAQEKQSGRFYFLELNTRTYYHNQLFADANVDLTQIAYYEMTGRDFRVFLPEPVQQDGIYWIDLIRDAASFAVKWRRGELGIRDWWRSVRMASSFALLDRRDFKPFVASIVRAISKAIIEGVSQVKAQLRRRP